MNSTESKIAPGAGITVSQPVRKRRSLWRDEFLSPRYLLARAIILSLLFGIVHFAGLREYTTFLTGTTAKAGVSLQASAWYGTIYILLYLGFVVVAPILVIAAGLLVGWQKLRPLTKPTP